MLYLTRDLIPNRELSEDFIDLFGLSHSYKPRKRLRLPSEEERVLSLAKTRKTRDPSDKFEVKLDVSHFRPEEINIKVIGNDLMVEGKHDERQDDNGFISRQFTRRYELSKDIDLQLMTGSLSTDGKLIICAPIKPQILTKERLIPINVEKCEPKPKLTTQITLAQD
jgi:crystallin alpha B